MEETVATTEPSATPELAAASGHAVEVAHAVHDHPRPAKYVGIAIILAVVTAIEVALYYVDLPDGLLVALLMGLAAIKFGMVAAYFMHLKFDSRMLRRLFVAGIILAAAVYAVVLVTMDILFG